MRKFDTKMDVDIWFTQDMVGYIEALIGSNQMIKRLVLTCVPNM